MQTVPFLKGLAPMTTTALERSARRVAFRPHDILFSRGDAPRHIFAVLQGRVKVGRATVDGATQTLLILDRGDIVGSLAVAQSTPHPVTASALDEVQCLSWTSEQFKSALAADPALADRMIRLVARRAKQMLDRLEELTSVPLEQRLARVLLRLVTDCGRECGTGEIRLVITRQELAELTDVTLPTVSRVMGRWRREKLIAGSRGEVRISDLAALSRIAGLVPEDLG